MKPPPLLSFIGGEVMVNQQWHGWFSEGFISWNRDKGVGLTADRPVDGISAGDYYFDSDLGIPIWYDSTNWIDATGSTV